MRELETRYAVERKKLMQVISQYLNLSNIKATLIQEPALDSSGIAVTEPVIQLNEQNIDSIRLIRAENSGWGGSGEALRFQYEIKLGNEPPAEFAQNLRARTKLVKEGKFLGLFGGKVAGVKWTGQELADILNQDEEISRILLRCAQIWEGMEIVINTKSSSEVCISGPWFTDANTIAALYSPGRSYEEQNCVLSYGTITRIAQIIRKNIPSMNSNHLVESKIRQ